MGTSLNRSLLSLAVFAAAILTTGARVTEAQVTAPAPETVNKRPKPPFKEEELAALLAPVALYPDKVLTTILMASTYPLEVVEAYRWVQQNPNLKGEALATEAKKQPWDPSVQALTATPDVLKQMDEKLDWTQKLGDAVLAQQKEVLAMIQTLRGKAKESGNLKSDDHMKVTTQAAPAPAPTSTAAPEAAAAAAPAPQVIVIESANPEVVYVPTYSSTSVYGYWGYPAYPPYYWPPPYGYPGSGFWWGVGVGVSIGFWGGAWNNNCDWHGGDINIGNDINIGGGDRGDRGDRGDARPKDGGRGGDRATAGNNKAGNKQSWSHNPEHRKGVSYRDNASASKFDKTSKASAASRDAFRGRTSAGTSDFGGGRSGAGASAGTSDIRGGGASAGTRDAGSSGSRGSASAGASTRDSGSRASSGASASNRSSGGSSYGGASSRSSGSSYGGSSSRGSSSAFGGMSSGSSSFSSRGGMSRGGGGGGRRR